MSKKQKMSITEGEALRSLHRLCIDKPLSSFLKRRFQISTQKWVSWIKKQTWLWILIECL